MDYAKPADVVTSMIDASVKKLALAPRDLLIRGALSGALLGAATSLAFGAAATTGQPLVGALVFPVGFVMIVLLGLELVTGSFALVPLAALERKSSWGAVIANWAWVFLGNLLGSIAYGALLAIALTSMGQVAPAGVAASIVKVAEAKTIGYEALGFAGHGDLVRQGHSLQLAGLSRRRDGDDIDFDRRQDRGGLVAHRDVLRPGL